MEKVEKMVYIILYFIFLYVSCSSFISFLDTLVFAKPENYFSSMEFFCDQYTMMQKDGSYEGVQINFDLNDFIYDSNGVRVSSKYYIQDSLVLDSLIKKDNERE